MADKNKEELFILVRNGHEPTVRRTVSPLTRVAFNSYLYRYQIESKKLARELEEKVIVTDEK